MDAADESAESDDGARLEFEQVSGGPESTIQNLLFCQSITLKPVGRIH
jgi:hypothetical protein